MSEQWTFAGLLKHVLKLLFLASSLWTLKNSFASGNKKHTVVLFCPPTIPTPNENSFLLNLLTLNHTVVFHQRLTLPLLEIKNSHSEPPCTYNEIASLLVSQRTEKWCCLPPCSVPLSLHIHVCNGITFISG